jgi:hypothetical protein
VKRVYLDQWVWVRLARAAFDQDVEQAARDSYLIAKHGKALGQLTFPLSTSHYIETYYRRSLESRLRLASVMAELSGFDTMVSSWQLLPGEIDDALRSQFGRPAASRTVSVFGHGASHAFGQPELGSRMRPPDWLSETNRYRWQKTMEHVREVGMLAHPDEDDWDPASIRESAEQWVAGEDEMGRRAQEFELERGGGRRDVLTAKEMVEILDDLNTACLRAGLSAQAAVNSLGRDGMTNFVLSMPVRGTVHRLRQLYHENPNRPRRANDMHDIESLSVAVAHCDIVVAERHAGDMLRRAGAPQRFATTLITSLAELPAVLAAP